MAFAGILVVSALLVQSGDTAPRLRLTGWATASVTVPSRSAGGRVPGRMFGERESAPVLNVLDLALERIPAHNRLDAGVRIEPILGTNAAVVRAAGLDLGRQAELWQAFGVLQMPLGAGAALQLKGGKMATLMGVEGFEDFSNPTLDVGPQDIFLEPFSETGVQLQVQAGFDAQLRVSQGWDRVSDNNAGKTVTLRIAVTPDPRTGFAALGYSGPEQRGVIRAKRSGAELIVSRVISPRIVGRVQFDYGREDALGAGGRAATWRAAGLWLTYRLSDRAGIGTRADYVCDCDGARTSGGLGFPVNLGQELTGLTVTLNVRRGAHLLLRAELRTDRSTLPVFDGRRRQHSAGMGVTYIL